MCTHVESTATVGDFSLVFFQAEDGIRDLVRSRGLGDVYKRQLQNHLIERHGAGRHVVALIDEAHAMPPDTLEQIPVSYTHLTLPTSDLG